MDLVLDSLSIWLLVLTVLLALVHLVLLRKPDPATHPLLLGRQSELNKVRKPNESPAFVSGTAGLGGQAKQLLKNCKTVQQVWQGKDARLALGTMGIDWSLDGKVAAMRGVLTEGTRDKEITIRLDDPADNLVSTLACSILSAPPPLLLFSSRLLATHSASPLITSTSELPLLRGSSADSNEGHVYLVKSGGQAKVDSSKFLPDGWTSSGIDIEELDSRLYAKEEVKIPGETGDARFVKMLVGSEGTEGVLELSHKNLIDGGIISLLSMFPQNERPTAEDRIMSYENTSTPYGLAVALTGAAVGASLRLCSSQKGIVSKCRTYSPSMIFCTPNELNAIRAALRQALPKQGLIVPLALAIKRSTLRAGSVSKTTMWDNLIFSKIRAGVVGENLRCIVCSAEEGAGPSNEVIEYLRLILGIPIIVALTHPLVAGPVTNTMYHDYQSFADQGEMAQMGAPSATVESKLVGVNEEDAAAGVFKGELAVRGPSVITGFTRLQGGSEILTKDGWIKTGLWVELRTNGTVKMIKAA